MELRRKVPFSVVNRCVCGDFVTCFSRSFLRIAVREWGHTLLENDMRAIAAALVATTMTLSSAFAADGALTAGKPAGTRQAQIETGGVLLVAGILAVAAVIAVVASTTQGKGTSSSTATTG